MMVMDEWLRKLNKEPFVEMYMEEMNEMNILRFKKELLIPLLPFIFGKTRLISEEVQYINSIFREPYQLDAFYRLYREFFMGGRIQIVPVISFWNNYQKEQYICKAMNGDIYLTAIEIPIDKAIDNLFIELFIKNYLQIFNNFGELNVSFDGRITDINSPSIRIVDSNSDVRYSKTLPLIQGLNIGKYLVTKDCIVTMIGGKVRYWDYYSGEKSVKLSDMQTVSTLLTHGPLLKETTNKSTVMNIRQKYFINLLKNKKENDI